jgi:hypothetical protein
LAFAKTGISEVEQVLFYSIPGSTFWLFLGLFMLLHSTSAISIGGVGAAVASVVPIGFMLYQAYTANALWLYDFCLRRKDQRCLLPIEQKFQECWNGDSSEIYHLSKRVLTEITNQDKDRGPYIWRLIDIVNARGVTLFACVISAFAPLSYLLFPQLLSSTDLSAKMIAYYLLLILASVSLYRGIPKIRRQLDAMQELIVGEKANDVDRLVRLLVQSRKPTMPTEKVAQKETCKVKSTAHVVSGSPLLSDRVDDVFKVFLIVSSLFLSLVQVNPGLPHWSNWNLVFVTSTAIAAWAVGYVAGVNAYSTAMKLTGWLVWINELVILVIFSQWGSFVMQFQTSVRFATGAVLTLAVILTWAIFVRASLYPRQEFVEWGTVVPLVIGVALSIVLSIVMLY